MSSTIEVTNDELNNFHAAHFGKSYTSHFTSTFLGSENSHGYHDNSYLEEDEEMDDGLGYYQDGVKRTLTDEQIAIFRHSELEALSRAERHAEEARASTTELLKNKDKEITSGAVDTATSGSNIAPVVSRVQAQKVQAIIGPLRPSDIEHDKNTSAMAVDDIMPTSNSGTPAVTPDTTNSIADDPIKPKRKRNKNKSKHPGQRGMHTQPDLRKRTWDVVEKDATGELDY